MNVTNWLEQLAARESSIALRESLYLWPLLESTHVLTLALFAGTAMVLDFRLLGWGYGSLPVSALTGRLLPWTRAGFLMMVVTGLLLWYANPVRYYHNVFFRLKVVVLAIVGFNIWWFHARVHQGVAAWDNDEPPPAARLAAVVSLTSWAIIIVAGRLIAYNWFDCDLQPQSVLINILAGCPATPVAE